jgi:AraC-like DNA-binding protein
VQPRAFLAGTLRAPWTLRPGPRPKALGIRFRPGGVARFLQVPMADLVDRETPLVDLWGKAAAELENAVHEAPSLGGALSVAGAWLSQRLAGRRPQVPAAQPAVEAIVAARGQVRIEAVARELGWSRRRLERAFGHDLGISPKLFARIVRLNAVLASLGGPERSRATDLALDAGYFDQAHLLRDFRDLAGATPERLQSASGELSRSFTSPERLRAMFFTD